MSPLSWQSLSLPQRQSLQAIEAFLEKRLEQQQTINWALSLSENDQLERIAIVELLNRKHSSNWPEPWKSAWVLVKDYWENLIDLQDTAYNGYALGKRIADGDHSSSLVSAIVNSVKPVARATIKHDDGARPSRKPRTVDQLVNVEFVSGPVLDPAVLRIESLDDEGFLAELAHHLSASINHAINTAQRIGWNLDRSLWRMGGLNRVYYVPATNRPTDEDEPDEFHDGIAPAVKMLYAVVTRLADLLPQFSRSLMNPWKSAGDPVHQRLWAALARDPRLAEANEVGAFLMSSSSNVFWRTHSYPEVAEARAVRFKQLPSSQAKAIIRRILRGPPKSFWSRSTNANERKEAASYSILAELRRIQLGGGELPSRALEFLVEGLMKVPSVADMSRVDSGFLGGTSGGFVPPNPDSKYDSLSGVDRLKALESALHEKRIRWDDDPSARAVDWMRLPGHAVSVFEDLEAAEDLAGEYTSVLEQLGWTLAIPGDGKGTSEAIAKLPDFIPRVLKFYLKLPAESLAAAIEGTTYFLSKLARDSKSPIPYGPLWRKLWPIAVAATNAQQNDDEEPNLNTVVRGSGEERDLDSYNTPAGRLLDAFLTACSHLADTKAPFTADKGLRQMRKEILSASGRARLVAFHRMIEAFGWFLYVDHEWTVENLVPPLLDNSSTALIFWRAIAHRRLTHATIKEIGSAAAVRILDSRLGRETRQSLLQSIVLDALRCLYVGSETTIAPSVLQQILRSISDEDRASAANCMQMFVVSGSRNEAPEARFRKAVKPFLAKVWPQENSLVSSGVARSLADLPVSSRAEFAEAVKSIERFLVPFQCWAMHDYGFKYDDERKPDLKSINGFPEAEALLWLLDLTIGTADDAVVPYDLGIALDHIINIASMFGKDPRFRRLAALDRRR